jgi:hypothetical protein
MKNLLTITALFTLFLFLLLTTSINVNAQWIQKGLDIDGEAADDDSGISVSMSADGNTLAIGAGSNDGPPGSTWNNRGHVRIYEWNGTFWNQKGQDIDGEAYNDNSGFRVSMSADGNTLAIGAPYNDGGGSNAGHVRVYEWNGTSWNQKGQDIDGEAANDISCIVSMSADGNTLAIGATRNDGTTGDINDNRGHVRIYEWNGTSWNQKGQDIDGETANDQSGTSVSMSADGNTVAIGAHLNDWVGSSSGHVRIYEWNGTSWNQKGQDINGEASSDYSGSSVSMSSDGNTVAIGAPYNDGNGSDAGHVRVYNWNGTVWAQKGVDIDGEAAGDQSGASVSMSADGNTLAIGAVQNDGTGPDAGHVRIYEWNGASWNQKGQDIDGEAAYDKSGVSVSICAVGDTLAIGAYLNDGAATDAGHVRVYDFCIQTSSVYLHSACDSFTWIDGNTYTTSNNTATYTLTNALGCDSVITLDLTINNSSTGTDIQTACDSYNWIDGNTYTNTTNTPTYTLTNTQGCDSVVTLNLTINTVDSLVTQNGINLSANQTGASYQWVECPAMTPINGATSQSYTATANGDYAVIVSHNNCVDTSVCYTVSTVGIIENDFGNQLIFYPNPSDGDFTIDLGSIYESITIKLTDLNGKLIETNSYKNTQYLHLKIEEPVGIYLLNIETESKKAIIKLIKE